MIVSNVPDNGFDPQEFVASFWAYVDSRAGVDRRAAYAVELAKLSPTEFIEMMGEVPHDVASVFSGCAWVPNPAACRSLEEAKGRARVALAAKYKANGIKLVECRAGHPAAALFEGLLKSRAGFILCLNVCRYLAWAATQEEFRPYLASPNSDGRGHAADDGPALEPAAAPPRSSREGILVDQPEDDDGVDDAEGDDDE